MAKINMIPPDEFFTPEELKRLMVKSDFKGLLVVLKPWLAITLIFVLVAKWTNPITILLAVLFLGGQQLAVSVIMHDAGHYSIFKTRKLNRILGNILGAWPVWHNVEQYGHYHYKHHRHAGTADDPDIKLALNFPTKVASFFRKMMRDLSGVSGFKANFGLLLMHFGYLKYSLGGEIIKLKKKFSTKERVLQSWKNIRGPLAFQIVLFSICYAIGYWWLFIIWWLAFMTSLNFCIRIRSMAEHSMTPDITDPYCNVRTTYANFLERLFFAPLNVNYHAEHHLLMGVPSYKYPEMHQMLLKRGYFKKGVLSNGYWPLVKQAVGKI